MDPSLIRQIIAWPRQWWRESIVDRYRLWGARIRGVEITQSIQYYRADEHLTDAADRGPDNSVQLVAYKAAWVRVYVRAGIFGRIDSVGGTLELARRSLWFGYNTVATYSPQAPGAVAAEEMLDYDTERGGIDRTLNFIIPSEEFHGTLRLTVRLSGFPAATREINVSARLIQTLRVRAILVSYNGPSTAAAPAPGMPPPPNLNLAAPTLADVQATAALALTAMPVQATGSFASAGTLAWNLPLDDPRSCNGCCSANWNQLLTQLTTTRTNDGNRADVVYYGLLPAGIPLNVPGCGNNGLGSAAVGDQGTFMHEIGHGYGFAHTPCGAAGATDANYPTYEPYGAASIGEYGLDIRNGNILDPGAVRDYMSYCFPQWMSLYQHGRLLQHARLDPRWVADWPWWKDYIKAREFEIPELWLPDPPPWLPQLRSELMMNPVISLIGEVRDAGEVIVHSVARVRAAGEPDGVQTRWAAQLLDEKGDVLSRAPIFRVDRRGGCGCGGGAAHDPNQPPFSFQAFVADVAPGAALRIIDSGKEVWLRRAPTQPLRIEHASAMLVDDRLALEWRASGTAPTEAWIQWSDERAERWHGLATGLVGGKADVVLAGLPAGPVLLRLLVHDGFHTATSQALRVELPERLPEVAVLHPAPGQVLVADRPMQLCASASDSAGVPIANESLSWVLDGTSAGRGREVWVTAPKEGEHKLVFLVQSRAGTATREVVFRTRLRET